MKKRTPEYQHEALPAEVSTECVKVYVERLAGLIDNDILRKAGHFFLPDAAVDFIGRDRVAQAEISRMIRQFGQEVLDASGPAEKKVLYATISRLVNASKNPPLAMALISRIWKYLLQNQREDDGLNDSLCPADFQLHLEDVAKNSANKPLTYAEEFILVRAFQMLREGTKLDDVFEMIDAAADEVFEKAYPETDGDDSISLPDYVRRSGYLQQHDQLMRMRDYISDKIASAAKARKSRK